jgi:hypothetical protein
MTAIAAIHAGLRQLGIDEETARDLYERETGKRSLRAMSEGERRRIVAALRESGFRAASGPSRRPLKGRYAPILQALWLSAWHLGVVRSRDDQALIAFVVRQTAIEHLNWVRDAEDAAKAIEALKDWMRRETASPGLYRVSRARAPWRNNPKVQVIAAQWDILTRRGGTPSATLEDWRPGLTAAMVAGDGPALDAAAADLGRLVRASAGAGR